MNINLAMSAISSTSGKVYQIRRPQDHAMDTKNNNNYKITFPFTCSANITIAPLDKARESTKTAVIRTVVPT